MATKPKKSIDPILKLAEMTAEELSAKASEISGSISKKRLELAIGRNKNTREVFNLRQQLARIKTVLNIKKMK